MDDATQKVVERIAKLMQLAERNPNQEEAASALAKANELLEAYNLDMSTIESATGKAGKRVDEYVSGGMHKFQRRLWEAIAELNYCFFWVMKVRVKPGSIQERRGRRYTHELRLVGREVNVIATKNMASYLLGTIERLTIERLGGEAHKQRYSSWAVAFREGIADAVIEKIQQRRQDIKDKEELEKREAAKRAAAHGVSTSTALTLADVEAREEQANYDFLHGEGAWARKQAHLEELKKEMMERRRHQAEAQAAAEKEYAEWAAAHPEEAAAEAKKEAARQRARERAAERRVNRQRYFRMTKEDMRQNSDAYHHGLRTGDKVSIDPQVDEDKRRLKHG